MLRIVTFNVLAPELAGLKVFPHSTKEQLDPLNRLSMLKFMLEQWMNGASYDGGILRFRWQDMKPIICLQELTLEWVGELSLWLLQRGYNLFATNYGNVHCGFMGVGVAVPQQFNILKVSYGLPSLGPLPDSDPLSSEICDEIWNMARSKYNRYVALKLSDGEGIPYWIITYHMPCCWRTPELMLALASFFRTRIDELTGSDPVILAGDFNFTPGSPPYLRIVEGCGSTISDGTSPISGPRDGVEGNNNFRSAGSVHYSCRSGSPPPFEAQVDYIFYRGGEWTSVELEPVMYMEGPIPNDFHPSDHLPLVARFHRGYYPIRRTPSHSTLNLQIHNNNLSFMEWPLLGSNPQERKLPLLPPLNVSYNGGPQCSKGQH